MAGAEAGKRPADGKTMQFLVTNRRTRIAMNASGLLFAFSLIALVSHGA
jgi:hypothetical protein